jgi:type I restriction enzyme M protein
MKDITSSLEFISRRHGMSNVFDDFMQIIVSTFCNGRDEDTYLNIIKKYEKEEINMFAKAFGALVIEYENHSSVTGEWDDVIGKLFESLSLTNDRTGQFFTPVHLCNLMARITDPDEHEDEISVSDPSAGSSRNLIAHSRMNFSNRLKCFYVAQDIDYRCCLMSVINMVLYGLKGIVIHCNTLSMEIYRGWRIYMPETGLMVYPLTKQQALSYLVTESIKSTKSESVNKVPEKPVVIFEPKQLSLF